jgi:Ca2+-binding RTX toxin-like protein
MPITASYSSVTRKITALGDALSNAISFTRDLAGSIFINGGAVPISGGPATVANTDFIDAFGQDLNDVITLDQTNGSLPAANLSGGNGNDTLIGGSNGDILNGDAGVDTLIGQGGIDQLFGGADGDTLAGGDANDTMNGEAGNDRMIWNPGDDDDVMEGGADSDIAEINGGNGAEHFTITRNGRGVEFRRVNSAPFLVDIGTTENLVLNANGGNDTLTTIGNLSCPDPSHHRWRRRRRQYLRRQRRGCPDRRRRQRRDRRQPGSRHRFSGGRQ